MRIDTIVVSAKYIHIYEPCEILLDGLNNFQYQTKDPALKHTSTHFCAVFQNEFVN